MFLAERKSAERKSAEYKSAERKSAELKLAERKSAEYKSAERKSAEYKSAERKSAERKSAEYKKGIGINKLSKHSLHCSDPNSVGIAMYVQPLHVFTANFSPECESKCLLHSGIGICKSVGLYSCFVIVLPPAITGKAQIF